MERIAKTIARSGLCSRREAERLILEGKVTVDGTQIDSPALNVDENNIVAVNGKIINQKEETKLWRYHKPKGLITSHKDPKGRPTVFEKLPKYLPRVISVGRLDFNTEGLLLLTNDGELSRKLELPSNAWVRRYRVRVHGKIDEKKLASLKKGITIEGIRYGEINATVEKIQGTNAWLSVAITEGKNREVRKVMKAIDLEVTRLIRVSYGPFQLGSLASGEVSEISKKILNEQIGALSKDKPKR